MNFSKETVHRLAVLARLGVSDEEATQFAGQLGSVLGYVEKLQEVSVDDEQYRYPVSGLENVMRPDVVHSSDAVLHDALLKEMPAREGDLLKVRAVFE